MKFTKDISVIREGIWEVFQTLLRIEQLLGTKRGTEKCPVCGGRGTVGPGFYSEISSTANTCEETCRACNGRGVLWGGVGNE